MLGSCMRVVVTIETAHLISRRLTQHQVHHCSYLLIPIAALQVKVDMLGACTRVVVTKKKTTLLT